LESREVRLDAMIAALLIMSRSGICRLHGRKGTASREVAEFYFGRGNYHAAESRFREALEYNPNDARAMFELAQCLEKMNHTHEALEEYRSCVEQQQSSSYAERSLKAIQRLTEISSAKVPQH